MTRTKRDVTTWDVFQSIFYLMWARAHRHFGIIRSDKVAFANAIEKYRVAYVRNPALARAFLERGILFWRELDLPRHAIRDLTAALDVKPGWPEALFCRALAYQALGDYPSAITDLKRYVESGDRNWRHDAMRQLSLMESIWSDVSPKLSA